MFAEPEFWVAVAFVILMGIFAYMGVHRTILTTLDHRSERIRSELADAQRLKQDAAKLLAEYKARRATAEREAADIVASAKTEAERIAAEERAKARVAWTRFEEQRAAAEARSQVTELTAIFEAKIVDVGYDAMTIMVAGEPDKLDAFSDLVKPFGIVELQRTGRIALPKLPRQPTRLRAVKTVRA